MARAITTAKEGDHVTFHWGDPEDFVQERGVIFGIDPNTVWIHTETGYDAMLPIDTFHAFATIEED